MTKWEKAKVFIAGAAVTILMMLLLGAASTNGIGRYQIAGLSVGNYFAVLDTTTGQVKVSQSDRTGNWDYGK